MRRMRRATIPMMNRPMMRIARMLKSSTDDVLTHDHAPSVNIEMVSITFLVICEVYGSGGLSYIVRWGRLIALMLKVFVYEWLLFSTFRPLGPGATVACVSREYSRGRDDTYVWCLFIE